jgi:putative chitinase
MNLDGLYPSIPRHVIDQLSDVQDRYSINTPLRLSHFLAQCAHESGRFLVTRENLNYSAQGLLKTFKRHFNERTAKLYARNPEAIANKVYGGRLGNTEITDGWKFRGRGYIQTTGKANYAELDKIVPEDLLDNPDLVSSRYAMLSAGFYWNSRKINAVADLGATEEVVEKVTLKVNGGTHGLKERTEYFFEYYQILNPPIV